MSMVQVKTSELIGGALDYATAVATNAWEFAHQAYPTMTLDPTFAGVYAAEYPRGEFGSLLPTCVLLPRNSMRQDPQPFCPSIYWPHAGLLIDRFAAQVRNYPTESGEYIGSGRVQKEGRSFWMSGPTPLVALCRAIVLAYLGDIVEVPEELVP